MISDNGPNTIIVNHMQIGAVDSIPIILVLEMLLILKPIVWKYQNSH